MDSRFLKRRPGRFHPVRSVVWASVAALGVAASVQAQARSQEGSVTQKLDDIEIRVDYRRPVARGRVLFGELREWGRVWTPGADAATTIEFTGSVLVAGLEVPAGKYSVWLVPQESGMWEFKLSRVWETWHFRYPGEDQDALSTRIQVYEGDHMETLGIYFPNVDRNRAIMHIHWGTTIVPVPIEVQQGLARSLPMESPDFRSSP